MAWALQFDGTNDYLTLNSAININSSEDFSIRWRWPADSVGNHRILGGVNIGASVNRIISFGNGNITLYDNTGQNKSFSAGIDVTADQEVEFRRTSGTLELFVDGVSQGTQASTQSFSGFGVVGGNFNTATIAGSLQYLRIDVAGVSVLDLNPDSSDHSNTGQQPVLVDTVGSNDATGVNMPTDGSAWIDLGGGATSATISESIVLSDSSAASVQSAAAISESIALVDAASAAATSSALISDQFVLIDAISAGLSVAINATVAEQFSLVDAAASQALLSGAISESITLTDAATSSATSSAAIAEQITLTDSAAVNAQTIALISDQFGLVDSINAVLGNVFTAQIVESISLNDSATAQAIASAGLSDSISLNDSIASIASLTIAASETISLIDSISASLSGANESTITESFTLFDSAILNNQSSALIFESFTLIDSIKESDTIKIYSLTGKVEIAPFLIGEIEAAPVLTGIVNIN